MSRKEQITAADGFSVLMMNNLLAALKAKQRLNLSSRRKGWCPLPGPRKSLNLQKEMYTTKDFCEEDLSVEVQSQIMTFSVGSHTLDTCGGPAVTRS